ncbi:LCP family protein [Dactylosporangium salmoneum]|uniref:Cell envelope-related transcriptional attenuator domain-containing protein n=1 Tax=Dactylosporangium salmoneum TaxID=53361 RepID=A0ABN3FYA4_9ACTN
MGATGKRRIPARKARSPLWARLCLTVGALLMLGSAGSLVGGDLLLAHYGDQVTHAGGLGSAAAGHDIDGPLNLLLVGIDERTGNAAMGARADSIIIVHVPASHDVAYLTSIPRDTRVSIPPDARSQYRGGTDKINAAFEFGYQHGGGRDEGLTLLAETVSNLAGGLKFNGAAIVNFDGFKDLVDALGGVHMCVDERTTSIHTGWNTRTGQEGEPYNFNADGIPTTLKPNMRPQVYEPGCSDMPAWQALDYVRQRDKLANNDGDYGRQRHQQQFIRAMLSKATSAGVLTNPQKVDHMLNSIGKAVSFYNNDIPLADWILTLHGITPEHLVTLKANNGQFNSEVVDGQSYEILDATTRQLLAAVGQDRVGEFVAAHPELVNDSTGTPASPASPAPSHRSRA